MRAHICHALRCKRRVPPSLLMCGRHWRLVPGDLKTSLWANYQRGQERRKNPSADWLVAAERCINAVAVAEGHRTEAEAAERIEWFAGKAQRVAELFASGALP